MQTYRIQLTENNSIKNPKAKTIIVVSKFSELVSTACSKFKINVNKHKIRFFIARQTINGKIGTEIKDENDFIQYIENDIMLAVSNEVGFKGKSDSVENYNPNLESKINRPPRYPYPLAANNNLTYDKLDIFNVNNDLINNVDSPITDDNYSIKYNFSKNNISDATKIKEMNGIFPIFKGNVLNLIVKAIELNPKIKGFHRKGYISFDYEEDTIFPDAIDWNTSIQRECRGLIVSTTTGNILARRFHKFFNINEREETLMKNIDLTGAIIQEKLDGSLVSPIMFEDSSIIWATRKNQCMEVEAYISNCKDIEYNQFAKYFLSLNITPLFEWCNDSTRVGVLYYSHKQLILLALRHNETGEYINIDKEIIAKFRVPVVLEHKIDYHKDDINDLLKQVKESTNKEGIVLTMENGIKYKFKSHWYISMCYSQKFGNFFLPEMIKLNSSIKSIPPDKIWFTAISNIDDVISSTIDLLDTAEAIEFKNFVNIVQKSISLLKTDLEHWLIESFDIIGNKQVITQVGIKSGWNDTLINTLVNNQDITNVLKNFLIKMTRNNQISSIEEMLDVKWNNGIIDYSNTILDLGNFHDCSNELKTHVLNVYLSKKISNYLGIKDINSNTIVNIRSNYNSDEGKIIGMWEYFTKDNIWDLRIDLQSQKKTGYTEHYGNSEYALLLVQYGLPSNSDEKPHGDFAGILVPTNYDIEFGDIISAMEQSFVYKKLVKLRRKKQKLTKYKVFCDLDGVLADFERGVIDLTGRNVESQTSSKMWDRIFSCPNFFYTLKPTQYCEYLWNTICKISEQIPTILTGVPQGKKQYPTEKLSWCKKYLDDSIENIITCKSADKYKYSNISHILIDDNYLNGVKWIQYGGIFIHHVTPQRTIYELTRIFGLVEKTKIDIRETLNLDYFQSDINVCFIDDKYTQPINLLDIAKLNSIVSIDSEWDPVSTKSVSIIQICTNNQVYIIDWINPHSSVIEQIEQIFKDNSIIKICYGIDKNELKRLNMNLNNIIDLQEVVSDIFDFQINKTPSLALTCSTLLNKKINKSKDLQAGKWEIRPLSYEQLYYAKCDVIILFELFEKIKILTGDKYLIPKKLLTSSTGNIKIKVCDDNELKKPVKILFSGVFLSEQSTKTLVNFIKPIHKNILANHLTLKYKPAELDLKGLSIGELVSIKINGYFQDDTIQAVRCECMNSIYHITISTVLQDQAKLSNHILKWNDVDINDSIQLFGQIGVQVIESEDLLTSLPERIKKNIIEFQQNALPEQKLKFKANELCAKERSVIHEYSKQMGIISESTGKEGTKKLVLTMGRKKKLNEYINTDSKIIKVTDKYLFSMLNIISDDYNYSLGGKILNNGYISSNHDIYNINHRTMYILRGLPGSGKSSTSNYLTENLGNCIICSADDYFYKDGIYSWDENKLDFAHEYCFDNVLQCIKDKKNVIVDNTNIKLKEFTKYIDLAKTYNYNYIVLEIYCKNKEQSILFSKRSLHSVPIQDVLKMYDRWEKFDDSILLEPYSKNNNDIMQISLNKWLDEKRVCHFTKSRNKTHLIMEIGTSPARFLDIPDEMMDEFIKIYSESTEPKYIMELITNETKFKLFFDFDYINDFALSDDCIYEIGRILLKSIDNYVINTLYITGCVSISANNKIKTGLHFKFDDLLVDCNTALELREKFILLLNHYDDKINWDLVIDKEVYSLNKGIRMFGSRKVTKGIDIGHVYELIGCLDNSGNRCIVSLDNETLLKKISIRYS